MTTLSSASTPSLGLVDFSVSEGSGLVVAKLDRFASLAKGGIAVGDELRSFNGTPTSELDSLEKVNAFAASVGVGNVLTVRFVRAGTEQELAITLLARKAFSLSLDEVDPTLERKIAPAA